MNSPSPDASAVRLQSEATKHLSLFPAELPTSYDASGAIASRFGDDTWDMSAMSTDGTTSKTLRFYHSENSASGDLGAVIRAQHKALMWLHIDSGKIRAWPTIQDTNFALNAWCNKAANRQVSLFEFLSNPEWVTEGSTDLNTHYLALTSAALKTMWRHREQLGAPADLKLRELRDKLNAELRSRPETKQTPLIPSSVYCSILSALDNRLNVIEREIGPLLQAYSRDREATRKAPSTLTPDQLTVFRRKALADVADSMVDWGFRPARGFGVSDFVDQRITEHQVTLMLVIVAYTGMRAGEVAVLPLENVLEEFEYAGSTHYEIKGSTQKFNKGIKLATSWITSHQGARAVMLCKRISTELAQQYLAPPKVGQQPLLFPSLDNPFKQLAPTTCRAWVRRFREVICPIIEQADIEELDRLELARDWDRSEISVGRRWPLAFHQLRRCLAVYAHRSGMVSLPALKAQLQHITQEMSSYYADGFSKAVNLVFDKKHFSHEWKAARAESSYFAYAFNVLFSSDDILGAGASRMANTVELRSRQDTLRLFNENKLAYRETALGGCVSTDECKTDPLEPIPYHCLETNCVNLVVFQKRLNAVVKFQEIAVATLAREEPGSVEHRLEARNLDTLLQANDRLCKRGS